MNHTDPETARLQNLILEREAEIATLRDLLGKENQRANAAIDREETAEQAGLEARQELVEVRAAAFRGAAEAQQQPDTEAEAAATLARECVDRPAVIRWCADRVRSTDGDYAVLAAAEYLDDLATEIEEAAEDEPAPVAQQPAAEEGPLYPARNAWTFEVCYDPDGDKWHGCGATYDSSVFDNAHETAQADFRHRAENDRQRRKFRMVRATTTYTVEAEHTPPAAAEQQAAAADGEGA